MTYTTINSLNIKIAELWQEMECIDRHKYPKQYRRIEEERSALVRERNLLLYQGDRK